MSGVGPEAGISNEALLVLPVQGRLGTPALEGAEHWSPGHAE